MGETPRDATGQRMCEHCMEVPVPESLGTKPRRYCSRNCRQRAYETRRQLRVVNTAVAVAVERVRGTSRDVAETPPVAPSLPRPRAVDSEPPPTLW